MKALLCCAVLTLAACGGSPSAQVQSVPMRSNVVAFMGDSITHRWTMPPMSNAVELNLGIVGNTTGQMWARFNAQVINAQVGIVVILGGTNDIIAGQDPDSLANITAMAEMAKSAGIRVILCTVPPDTQAIIDNTALNQAEVYAKENALNDALIKLAGDEGYQVADYHDVLINTDGTQDQALFLDGEHPNQDGYARMWSVVEVLITESLS